MFVTRLGHRVASVPLFHRSFSTATVFVRPLYKNPNLLMQVSTQLTHVGVAKRQMRNFFSDKSSAFEYLKMVKLEEELNGKKKKPKIKLPPLPGLKMTGYKQFVMEMMGKVDSKPNECKMATVGQQWRKLSYYERITYMIMATTYRMRVLRDYQQLPDAEQNEIWDEAVNERMRKSKERREYWEKTGHPPLPLHGFNLYVQDNFAYLVKYTGYDYVWIFLGTISREWKALDFDKRKQYIESGKEKSRLYRIALDEWKKQEEENKIKAKVDKKKQNEDKKRIQQEERMKRREEQMSKNPRRSKKNSTNSPIDITGVNKKCIENGYSKMDSPNEVGGQSPKVKKPKNKSSKKPQKKTVNGPFLMLSER